MLKFGAMLLPLAAVSIVKYFYRIGDILFYCTQGLNYLPQELTTLTYLSRNYSLTVAWGVESRLISGTQT